MTLKELDGESLVDGPYVCQRRLFEIRKLTVCYFFEYLNS